MATKKAAPQSYHESFREKINKKKYFNEDRMLYYKTFKKNENNRRRDLSSSSESSNNYSSSNHSTSSSDSFPSPETPKKRVKYIKNENENKNYKDLFGQVKELQQKVYEMELKNRRR